MRISVAMAVRNGERFIEEQLQSIARQSRLPDELVICDDGSTDRTGEIVKAFQRVAPFSVVLLPNQGPVGCRESFFRAIEACDGELITLADCDDVWRVDKLAQCERPFADSPHVSLVAHSATVVDEKLRPKGWQNPDIRRRTLIPAGTLSPLSGYWGFVVTMRAKFVRGADIASRPPGRHDQDGRGMAHDVWAALVCGALGDVVLLPDALALWRRHDDTDSWGGESDRLGARARRSLAVRSEEMSFSSTSAALRAHRRYLAQLRPYALTLGSHASEGLERAIQSYERCADAMDRRASVYRERSRRSRSARMIRNLLRGDYGRRRNGCLGVGSLARDLAVGVGWPELPHSPS